jgi:thioredoxin-like negative regulator of GroEL
MDMSTTTRDTGAAEKPRLLFFYGPQDGHSRRVEGFIAQVMQRRGNHDTFVIHRIDADTNRDLALRYRVEDVPTVLVVDGRRVRARLVRPTGCVDLRESLEPWLR